MLGDADGTVIEPTAAELAVAASASANGTAWLGCVVSKPGALMAGSIVAVLEGVPSPEACCRACRNSSATANVWNYCGRQGGCRCERGVQRERWVLLLARLPMLERPLPIST